MFVKLNRICFGMSARVFIKPRNIAKRITIVWNLCQDTFDWCAWSRETYYYYGQKNVWFRPAYGLRLPELPSARWSRPSADPWACAPEPPPLASGASVGPAAGATVASRAARSTRTATPRRLLTPQSLGNCTLRCRSVTIPQNRIIRVVTDSI